jgi:hypothetical protein
MKRTWEHYKTLFETNPDATVATNFGADAMYANRHGVVDVCAATHHTDEWHMYCVELATAKKLTAKMMLAIAANYKFKMKQAYSARLEVKGDAILTATERENHPELAMILDILQDNHE